MCGSQTDESFMEVLSCLMLIYKSHDRDAAISSEELHLVGRQKEWNCRSSQLFQLMEKFIQLSILWDSDISKKGDMW